MSRPENKENLQALADQVVWAIENYIGGGVENIPQSMGTLYYVSNVNGLDANDGLNPSTAKKTIGAAITACTAGDIIVIEAGTYPEDVDVDKDSVELWFELGAIIVAQAGAGLTVSGNYCSVITPNGSLRVNPIANGTGVVASGDWAYLWDIRVSCGSSADLGFDFTGDAGQYFNCRASDPLIAAFKLQGDGIKLDTCYTGGTPADTSIGFWVTNNADKTRLRDCASQGHASGGYVIDTGVTNGEAINSVSGGGDGPRLDPTHAFVWAGYSFDNIVSKEVTLAGVPTTYDIFKVTGIVAIKNIYGVVNTVIANTPSALHLDLVGSGAPVPVTKIAGAPDIDSLPVDSLLAKIDKVGVILSMSTSAAVKLIESTVGDPKQSLIIIGETGTDTYIRMNLTAALASGAIHWHLNYEPMGDDSFVEPA